MAHHHSIHYVPTVRGAVIGFDHFTRDADYVSLALDSLDVLDGRAPSCTLDLVYLWLVASTTSDEDREEYFNRGNASQAMPFYLYCETYEIFLQAALVISDAWSNGVFERSLFASEFPGIVTTSPPPPELNVRGAHVLRHAVQPGIRHVRYAHTALRLRPPGAPA